MGGMHIEDGMSSGSHRSDVRLLLAITEPSNNKEPTSRDGLSQRVDHMTGKQSILGAERLPLLRQNRKQMWPHGERGKGKKAGI